MTLKEAYETMLKTAEARLASAIAKNKEWDINHYTNDIAIIKGHLKEL